MKKSNYKFFKCFTMFLVAIFCFLLMNKEVYATSKCVWRFFSPMIDNVSGEIIDDDGLKKISNDYKLGSLYDDSEDDYKYDAPDYEYADLKLEDEIIDSWYFWYNHDDKKKVTQVTGESKVEKKKGKKKKNNCPSIVFKNSGGQAGTNTNYAIIISGNYTDDELIKLVATGYGRNTKLVYCKKDDEVNNCYPPVAYGVQFNQEAPFFAEKDEKNIDDEIDPGVLAIDSYKESGKTKKGSLYSILMNFSEDSENILESFDGGNKPSKNYGEYIIYMASKDAWLKKVKETSNKSEVAQERVRKVFKLWWNHVKYYSLPSFFSTDRAEEGYSDIAAKMKIEGEGEDKKYTFDGNLDDYEFFTFSKFYYNNDSTYKTMVESTIKYIGSIIQTNNLNEMDDKYKKMDTNKYLKEYRKKYISCFAVPGNAVYEACGNPPFTGQTTIDTCTDKINEMMENDNSDTCISRASEQYWDLINLTNSNNNLNRNDLDELFYQSAASSMEKTYRDCLKELLKNKYPGLTEEQFNTCNTKLESDKTTASGIDEDYKDAYDFKKKLESEIRLNWNDGEIDITQGTEIEIDCSKLEPFRDIWVIVIRSAPFLLILFGSIDYFKVVTAGDPDSIKKAKKQFKTRLLAFVLLLVIPFVIKFILNTFGTRGAQSIETMRCIVDGE